MFFLVYELQTVVLSIGFLLVLQNLIKNRSLLLSVIDGIKRVDEIDGAGVQISPDR